MLAVVVALAAGVACFRCGAVSQVQPVRFGRFEVAVRSVWLAAGRARQSAARVAVIRGRGS
jgi:hypothetical protein